ncbi:kelch domain-containing protein 7A [Pyxicephalus adspersus]|uniref:kelch domain-containing protein 7A n=1 Tax=Pyxicephalus adspersus TaxID=30357 RepID=UPI003B5AA71D
MINIVCENRVWHFDMQLMGKVVLSAAALFFLGLAYRFYKFRALERSEQSDKHDPGPRSAEGDVVDSPQRDYTADESSNLRFRRVNSNLQNGLVTDPGRKHLADSSLGTHEVRVTAQEGFETVDVICKDQNDYCREVTELLHNNADPLQSHRRHEDDTTRQKDVCDGKENINKKEGAHSREDPEGREMLEKSESVKDHSDPITKNITILSSIDLSLSHQNERKQELHRFCSTAEVQMQESIIAEDGNPFQTPGGLRGKIYDYHTTSQSVTEVNTSTTGNNSSKSSLSIITSNIPASKEGKETHTSLTDLVENTEEETKGDNSNQGKILQKQHLTSESNTKDENADIGGDVKQIRSISNFSITSQSIPEIRISEAKVCTPQSKLLYIQTNLPIVQENEEMQTSTENTENISNNTTSHQANPLQDSSNNTTKVQRIESPTINFNSSTSSSQILDQNIGAVPSIQTDPGTFHVSLTPGSEFDIHIDLKNCYEVLSFAKKHNLETLKAAAYKKMSNDYLQVLQNSSIYGYLNATERDLILEGRMKGRRFVVVADIDTQATSASQNQSSLSYYDNDNDTWHSLSKIPVEAVSRGSSMATMFNYLFVALGCDGLGRQMKPSRRVLCYNPITDSWKEISPLNEARPHCKLVALDGFLYAIGGECLHTVEKYDPRQNRWTYIAPLPNDTFAVAHMATAYDDEIFVTGGTFRYMLLRYKEREQIWKSSLVSGSKDRTTEMVASNNFLYRFDLNRSMGISVHRCNIRARIWYECATFAMPYPAPFQCTVIDNNIYCISRNFHMRFLAEDISPRFMDTNLHTVPSPKGVLFPFVLVLPVKGTC